MSSPSSSFIFISFPFSPCVYVYLSSSSFFVISFLNFSYLQFVLLFYSYFFFHFLLLSFFFLLSSLFISILSFVFLHFLHLLFILSFSSLPIFNFLLKQTSSVNVVSFLNSTPPIINHLWEAKSFKSVNLNSDSLNIILHYSSCRVIHPPFTASPSSLFKS